MMYKHFTVNYYKDQDETLLAIFPIDSKSQVEHCNFNYEYAKRRFDMFQRGIPTKEQIVERELSLKKEIQSLNNAALIFLGPEAAGEAKVFSNLVHYFVAIHDFEFNQDKTTYESLAATMHEKGSIARKSDPVTFDSLRVRFERFQEERYFSAVCTKYRERYSDEELEELAMIFKEAVERLVN